ncbi:diacylglycerol kinase family protein [Candidatus Microgenomates bacterium]|nr:diacylglycerol kinase family protein [Candidatus Microgenomates bacterium]
MAKKRNIISSFVFAFQGIRDGLKNEPNLKIHFALGLVAILLAWFLRFSHIEWAILILTIFLVITLEFINTVIEKIVDTLSPQITESARITKDISAAVVLIGAVASIVVGLFLFLPKL